MERRYVNREKCVTIGLGKGRNIGFVENDPLKDPNNSRVETKEIV